MLSFKKKKHHKSIRCSLYVVVCHVTRVPSASQSRQNFFCCNDTTSDMPLSSLLVARTSCVLNAASSKCVLKRWALLNSRLSPCSCEICWHTAIFCFSCKTICHSLCVIQKSCYVCPQLSLKLIRHGIFLQYLWPRLASSFLNFPGSIILK